MAPLRCWAAVAVLAAAAAGVAGAAAAGGEHPDRVRSLPGLAAGGMGSLRMYAGGVVASAEEDAATRTMFYTLVESERDAARDPVVLWLSGGPGCSGMTGFWMEHGPFRIEGGQARDGRAASLRRRALSWSRVATVLYVDSPCGVGYSTAKGLGGSYAPGDNATAADLYRAVQRLAREVHPWLLQREWFVFGESYGGVYVAQLADRIEAGRDTFPLRLAGVGLGNAQWVASLKDNSTFEAYERRGMVPASLVARLQACEAGGGGGGGGAECEEAGKEWEARTLLVNQYNMNEWCFETPQPPQAWTGPPAPPPVANYDPPCYSGDAMVRYMNRPDVREALHAPEGAQNWTLCQLAVAYVYRHEMLDTRPLMRRLVHGGVRVLVYNGDGDTSEPWFESLGRVQEMGAGVAVAEAAPWTYALPPLGPQAGGFVTRYAGGNLTFTTIRGAGHLSPRDRPAAVLRAVSAFLDGAPLCGAAGDKACAPTRACHARAGGWGAACTAPVCNASCASSGGACLAPGLCTRLADVAAGFAGSLGLAGGGGGSGGSSGGGGGGGDGDSRVSVGGVAAAAFVSALVGVLGTLAVTAAIRRGKNTPPSSRPAAVRHGSVSIPRLADAGVPLLDSAAAVE